MSSSSWPAPGGLLSINGDTTAAQTIAAGINISVATVNGTTTISGTTGETSIPLGSAATPGLGFTAHLSTGIFSHTGADFSLTLVGQDSIKIYNDPDVYTGTVIQNTANTASLNFLSMVGLDSPGGGLSAGGVGLFGGFGAVSSSNGGPIQIISGDSFGASSHGGSVQIFAGSSIGVAGSTWSAIAGQSDTQTGGQMSLTAGYSASGTGGDAILNGGPTSTGTAGAAQVIAGAGSGASYNGGNALLSGSHGKGAAKTSGDAQIRLGVGQSTAASGKIRFQSEDGATDYGTVNSSGLWTLGASGGTQTHVINGSLNLTGGGSQLVWGEPVTTANYPGLIYGGKSSGATSGGTITLVGAPNFGGTWADGMIGFRDATGANFRYMGHTHGDNGLGFYLDDARVASITDGGNLRLTGNLGVGNAAAATVGVGTIAKKIEVFDASGTSLGFIPVYTSIT